jgi:formate dehydrogenase major subunit
MSDPDANHAREALAALDHLVVQDIFLTETAYLADVILPATAFSEKTGTFTNTDRLVQMGRQAIDPPGQAKPDLWIIQQLARSSGWTGTMAMCRKCSTRCGTACPASPASPGTGWSVTMR